MPKTKTTKTTKTTKQTNELVREISRLSDRWWKKIGVEVREAEYIATALLKKYTIKKKV